MEEGQTNELPKNNEGTKTWEFGGWKPGYYWGYPLQHACKYECKQLANTI